MLREVCNSLRVTHLVFFLASYLIKLIYSREILTRFGSYIIISLVQLVNTWFDRAIFEKKKVFHTRIRLNGSYMMWSSGANTILHI